MMDNIWPKKGAEPAKASIEPPTAEEMKRLDEDLYLRLPNRFAAFLVSFCCVLS